MAITIRQYWESVFLNAVNNAPLPADFSTLASELGISAQTATDLASVTGYLANRALVATIPSARAAIAAHNEAAKLAADQAVTPAEMNTVYNANQTESNALSDNLQSAKVALAECNLFEQNLLPVLDVCRYVNLLKHGIQ